MDNNDKIIVIKYQMLLKASSLFPTLLLSEAVATLDYYNDIDEYLAFIKDNLVIENNNTLKCNNNNNNDNIQNKNGSGYDARVSYGQISSNENTTVSDARVSYGQISSGNKSNGDNYLNLVEKWSVRQVTQWLNTNPILSKLSTHSVKQGIDGKSLLNIYGNQEDGVLGLNTFGKKKNFRYEMSKVLEVDMIKYYNADILGMSEEELVELLKLHQLGMHSQILIDEEINGISLLLATKNDLKDLGVDQLVIDFFVKVIDN